MRSTSGILFCRRSFDASTGGASPKRPELFDRAGAVARVMIVRESENLNFPLVDFFQHPNPFDEVRRPVLDNLVPRFGFFLDSLAVSEPAHIRKIRSDWVEAIEELPGP